jgi:hypothetical protein
MDMAIYPYPYSIPIKYWVRLYADPTYYNIEKILKDRLKNGIRQFLVKWHGYDSSHNSWEPASVFVSPQIIEDYWASKNN